VSGVGSTEPPRSGGAGSAGAGAGRSDFKPGLEGVVAFETEIAEPDREGGALRYRGVDIEELVGSYRFEQVWGLLVDESFSPGLPVAEPYEGGGLTGNTPADLQAVTARLGAEWGVKKLIDISDDEAREDLRRLSAQFISIAAQSARIADGHDDRIAPQAVAQGQTTAERFFLEWRGEADPKHVQALDTYWICTCEHGLNASTFVARITASTGSDCAAALSSAVGALSGPLHGGAPARVLPMLDAAAKSGDPESYVHGLIERGERLMGFGHRVYRAEDPRARLLKKTAKELGAPRYEVADKLEAAALEALRKKSPDRPLETNVEFWSAVVLDVAGIPPELAPAMFACSRTAGWSAHILEQKKLSRLVRPSARYVGPGARPASSIS
jgi:citrate synthase